MCYRLFRRPQISFLLDIVFVCLELCVCEFVGLWFSVLCVWVCVCVCVFVCVCVMVSVCVPCVFV